MNDEDRRDPEAFLDLVAQARKGTLKIYLGSAAGVGKTYRMLEEAHQLAVAGARCRARLHRNPWSRRNRRTNRRPRDRAAARLPYRGVILEEMDVDAIIARKPEFAIVDELPHHQRAGLTP